VAEPGPCFLHFVQILMEVLCGPHPHPIFSAQETNDREGDCRHNRLPDTISGRIRREGIQSLAQDCCRGGRAATRLRPAEYFPSRWLPRGRFCLQGLLLRLVSCTGCHAFEVHSRTRRERFASFHACVIFHCLFIRRWVDIGGIPTFHRCSFCLFFISGHHGLGTFALLAIPFFPSFHDVLDSSANWMNSRAACDHVITFSAARVNLIFLGCTAGFGEWGLVSRTCFEEEGFLF
jgi:hypothetical protein